MIELGSVVVDEAYIFDDDVVDFRVRVYEVEFVADGKTLFLLRDNFCIDLGVVVSSTSRLYATLSTL